MAFSFFKTVLPFPDVNSRNRTHSGESQIFPSEFLKNHVRRERLAALVFCFFQSPRRDVKSPLPLNYVSLFCQVRDEAGFNVSRKVKNPLPCLLR